MLKKSLLLVGSLLLAAPVLQADQPAQQQQRPAAPQSVEDRTAGMKKLDGYFPLYWDERTGGMLLEIPRFDTEFLFNTGLSAGLGSNDIGLDRGGGGGSRVVQFQRVGPRVMLVQGNQSFRSSSKNPLERKAVEDSFAGHRKECRAIAYSALFETILANIDKPDLGLGRSHSVKPIKF